MDNTKILLLYVYDNYFIIRIETFSEISSIFRSNVIKYPINR